jgi:hypothetical protein
MTWRQTNDFREPPLFRALAFARFTTEEQEASQAPYPVGAKNERHTLRLWILMGRGVEGIFESRGDSDHFFKARGIAEEHGTKHVGVVSFPNGEVCRWRSETKGVGPRGFEERHPCSIKLIR